MSSPQVRYNPFTNNFDFVDVASTPSGPYPGGVSSWVDVTGTAQTMAVNTGYTAHNDSVRVVFELPVTCAYGSYFRVVGKGAAGWEISQNGGQQIHFGNANTTLGVAGNIQSTQQYDSIELLCTVANTDFTVIAGPQGNISYT
jgi:hypothetical protein